MWLGLVKNPPAMQETWVQSLGWEDPLENGEAPAFWSEFLGLCSPWGRNESDMAEQLSLSHMKYLFNAYACTRFVKVLQFCLTLCYTMDCSSAGSPALLQGIFPTQGLNPGLQHCGQILYFLSHQGSLDLGGCCCCCEIACLTVRPHRRQPTRLHRPWDSPGKNTGVGFHFLQFKKV